MDRVGGHRGSLWADDGFSLLEMVVAVGLTLLITGAVFAVVNPASATSQVQPEAIDMAQRVRAGLDAIAGDLDLAGAGMSTGPSAGPLIGFFAPVIPRRIGLQRADPARTARSDVVTITFVPRSSSQTTIAGSLPQPAGLTVNALPNCPAGEPVCGFQTGMAALVFDETAHFDLFTIADVVDGAASVQMCTLGSTYTYGPGAKVAEAQTHVFYLDAAANQLRYYDGYQTDVPIADDIVGLSFEYFGTPDPPILPKPQAGTDNCLYDAAGNRKPAAVLGPSGLLVPLPLALLNDGPWCGEGGTEFDVDLLRVRMVRVTIRAETSAAAFRASGSFFARPGSALDSTRSLPDVVVSRSISPRNLNLWQ